jgi:hypothetical protein
MGGLLFLKNPDFKTTDHLEFARDLLKEMQHPHAIQSRCARGRISLRSILALSLLR